VGRGPARRATGRCATLVRVILFFGTRRRTRRSGSGTFHCPFCFRPRAYERVETRTWVHLFWVPLIPLGATQEAVVCTVCGGRWAPAVLGGDTLA